MFMVSHIVLFILYSVSVTRLGHRARHLITVLPIPSKTHMVILSISLSTDYAESLAIEKGIESTSIIQQTANSILITVSLSLLLVIAILVNTSIKHKSKNNINIFDLAKKPIPNIVRYREYLILLLRRLTTEYIISIRDTYIYKKTIEYLEEIMGEERMSVKKYEEGGHVCRIYSDIVEEILDLIDEGYIKDSVISEKEVKKVINEIIQGKRTSFANYMRKEYQEKVKEFCRKLGLIGPSTEEEGWACKVSDLDIDQLMYLLRIIDDVEREKSLLVDQNSVLCILFNREYYNLVNKQPVESLNRLVERVSDTFDRVYKYIEKRLPKGDKRKQLISVIEDIRKMMIECFNSASQCTLPAVNHKENMKIYPCIFIAEPYRRREPNFKLTDDKGVLKVTLNNYTVIQWEYVRQ